MVSFDRLKETAKDMARTGTGCALNTGKLARLSLINVSEEGNLKKIYRELGELYYAGHGLCPDPGYEALCDKVTETKVRMEENNALITALKINGVVDDEVCEPEEASE